MLRNNNTLVDDDIEVLYCRNIDHPGGNITATVTTVASGLIPIGFTTANLFSSSLVVLTQAINAILKLIILPWVFCSVPPSDIVPMA